jgi:hypothetical protein
VSDETYWLVGVLASALLAVALSLPIIRALRRRAYRGWPRPLRWAFLTLAGFLAASGGVLWTAHTVQTWGWQAGLWFLLAPAVYGLWRGSSTVQKS